MRRQYISGLAAGERVDGTFALRAKEMRAARSGDAYLSLEFSDRSGRIKGIMFRPGREEESIPAGTVARVKGVVTVYRGVPQISVESMRGTADYDQWEILPASRRDSEEMDAELRKHVEAIADPMLAAVVRSVFGDRGFMKMFRLSPATCDSHRACIGGLLEHTVAVAGMCSAAADLYPQINRDFLLAGALLHDIGVVDAISVGGAIELTDRGLMLGSTLLTERRLVAAAQSALLPAALDYLVHVVISHDAATAPPGAVRPRSLEAAVLSGVHELDVRASVHMSESRKAGAAGEPWTAAGTMALQHVSSRDAAGKSVLREGEPAA